METILEMKGIDKFFPGVRALDAVDFTLHKGEIHAIMGENGAGKTTLIKVLTAVHPLDGGEILLNGQAIRPKSPIEAQQLGISTVYQEVNLCGNLSVAENIFIGKQPMKKGMLDWKEMRLRARRILEEMDLSIDVDQSLASYSLAIQQMVAIARALRDDSKILILDEPTSSLDKNEVVHLFTLLEQLKRRGLSIIFISHFLDQVYQICDRATILRNGRLIGSYALSELPRVEMVSKMMGKELSELGQLNKDLHSSQQEADLFLSTDSVHVRGKVEDLNLQLYQGEVLGLAGLLGSGRSEVAELLFGVYTADEGSLRVQGQVRQFSSPGDAMKRKIALCPEDRKEQGAIGDLSVRENIVLALRAKAGLWSHMTLGEQEKLADRYIDLLKIKLSNREQSMKTLSGGNQQKAIIARWLATQPDLMILDEPTRGIDVGTKAEIQKMMVSLATDEHKSIVFISGELDELVRTCSRLLVFRDHRQVGELKDDDINIETIMHVIAEGSGA